MLDLCEAVVILGDAERAAGLRRMLAPHSGRVAAVARATLCYGPVDYYLGRLALACGDAGEAITHLERALAWSERAGAAPQAELARAGLAGARGETSARPSRPA